MHLKFCGVTRTVARLQEANAARYNYTKALPANDCYHTKYLTSSRLLRLQLRDPWFRRHIMVQFLIFFQSLRVVSESTANSQRLSEQQVSTYQNRIP